MAQAIRIYVPAIGTTASTICMVYVLRVPCVGEEIVVSGALRKVTAVCHETAPYPRPPIPRDLFKALAETPEAVVTAFMQPISTVTVE